MLDTFQSVLADSIVLVFEWLKTSGVYETAESHIYISLDAADLEVSIVSGYSNVLKSETFYYKISEIVLTGSQFLESNKNYQSSIFAKADQPFTVCSKTIRESAIRAPSCDSKSAELGGFRFVFLLLIGFHRHWSSCDWWNLTSSYRLIATFF